MNKPRLFSASMAAVIALMTAITPAQVRAQDPAPPVKIATPPGVTVEYPLADVDPVKASKDAAVRDADPNARKAARDWETGIHMERFRNSLMNRIPPGPAPLDLPTINTDALSAPPPTEIPVIQPPPKAGKAGGALYRPQAQSGTLRTIRVYVLVYQSPTMTIGMPEFPQTLSNFVSDLNVGQTRGGVRDLNYQVITQTIVNSLTPKVPPGQPHAGDVDIAGVFNTFGFCNKFETGDIQQVWLFNDGLSVHSPLEFGVKGRSWDTAQGSTNQPVCGEAGTIFNLIYANWDKDVKTNGGWYPAIRWQAMHSYSHYLEQAMTTRYQWDRTPCDYVDGGGRSMSANSTDTFYSSYCSGIGLPVSWIYGFSNHANANNGNVAMCGDVHFPPNITVLDDNHIYKFQEAQTIYSRCNSWNWGQSNPGVPVNCSTWSADCSDYDVSQLGYLIWWQQHLPTSVTSMVARFGGNRPSLFMSLPYLAPAGEQIVRNDYNGDRKTDYVLYRPSNGYFYVKYSVGSGYMLSPYPCIVSTGVPFTTWNYHGYAEFSLLHPAQDRTYWSSAATTGCASTPNSPTGVWTREGGAKMTPASSPMATTDRWFYNQNTGAWRIAYKSGVIGVFPATFTMGGPGFVPAMADYDNDRIIDPAVYNSATGVWKIRKSGQGGSIETTDSWGVDGPYIPQPADIDGDGIAELIIFNYTDGFWYVKNRSFVGGGLTYSFGAAGDIPGIADFDGDGWMDFAVFRPSSGYWYYMPRNGVPSVVNWGGGAPGDVPLSGTTW